MRIIAVAAVMTFAIFSGIAHAQSTVAGRVRDRLGNAMSGVTLTLNRSGSTLQTTTDADGGYVFSDLVSGDYTITASLAGFTTQTRAVSVHAAGSFAADLVLNAGCVVDDVTIDDGLPATMTAADAVFHVRITGIEQSATVTDDDCLQGHEYRATVLNIVKAPKLASDAIRLLLRAPGYKPGDELVVFVARHSSGAFVDFSDYTFPVRGGLVAWTRSELPGITNPSPVRQVLDGLRGVLFMVR